MKIEVWSDIGCPWCYIGKARLEQAIAADPEREAIELVFHSFELNPAEREPQPILEMLAGKYGMTPDQAGEAESRMVEMAHAEGLEYSSDRMDGNTFDLHRVLHLARDHGVANELLGSLQREHFSGRENVLDHTVLADQAAALGIPRERVEAVLGGDEFAEAVRADEQRAQAIGVTGVPFTVLDGRYAIPGAVAADAYGRAIVMAREEA